MKSFPYSPQRGYLAHNAVLPLNYASVFAPSRRGHALVLFLRERLYYYRVPGSKGGPYGLQGFNDNTVAPSAYVH